MPAPPTYDVLTIFSRIAEGDEDAFTLIYKDYVPQLAPFIRNITRSEKTVDEIIQETFLQVWLHRDRLPMVREPRAWIIRVASNLCYNYLRRLAVEGKALRELQGEDRADLSSNPTEEDAHFRDLLSTIGEAVEQLSPRRKKIYQLSREQGMSLSEIAAALDLSPHTVKNTLVSSLQFIREYLAARGYLVSVAFLAFLLL